MTLIVSVADQRHNRERQDFLQLARDEVDVALQPIVDIHSGRLVACEALVSRIAIMGLTSVQALLDEAVRLDALIELEAILIEKAVAAFASVRRSTWAMLFINIDARNAARPDAVVSVLNRALASRRLQPQDVCIEISERNPVTCANAVQKSVAVFKAAGFAVAIDDYGTGSSGMLLLHKCCPNFLKIDRFFTASIASDRRKKVMVASIVNLSHALGIRVIAEGVESVGDLHQCRDVRCDMAQGWLIARPTRSEAGIALDYPVVADNPDRRGGDAQSLKLRSRILHPATLNQDASLEDIMETFRREPTQSVIPMLDSAGMPIGIVHERSVKPFVYSRYGKDLARNRTSGIATAQFITRVPIADVHTPIAPLLDVVGGDEVDGILLTDEARYAGFLPFSAIAALANELRIETATDRNPLTRLPANGAVKDFIDTAATRDESTRLLCYVDLDNFKPFNDVYGFRAGDRALMMLADQLKGLQFSIQAFVGHIGGDDFFIGASDRDAWTLYPHLVRVQQDFRSAAESLYSAQDRVAGYVTARGRDGVVQHFDMLSCTIGMLVVPAGRSIVSGEQAAALLAQVKTEAKRAKGSILVRSIDDVQVGSRRVGAAA